MVDAPISHSARSCGLTSLLFATILVLEHIDAPLSHILYRMSRVTERALLDQKIWDLRANGHSVNAIANALNIHKQKVNASLRRIAEQYKIESAELIIKLELDRLDILLQKAMEILNDKYLAYSHGKLLKDEDDNHVPDPTPVLKAIDAVAKIMDRRSKYLGLDAPSRSEHHMFMNNQPTEADLQVMALVEEFKKRAQAITPEQLKGISDTPHHPEETADAYANPDPHPLTITLEESEFSE